MKLVKSILLGTAAAIVAVSVVHAADLPIKAAPAPVVTPAYNWTGFYVGGNLGGVWSDGSVTDSLTGISLGTNRTGWLGGFQAGANYQFGRNWVVGIEGTWDWTSLDATTGLVPVPGTATFLQGSANTDWVATLAGRVGFAANNWLFYAKGGGGWVQNSASLMLQSAGGVLLAAANASNTNSGWLLGGGIEYGITPNWTVKVEYNHLELRDWTSTNAVRTFAFDRNLDMVTAGFNYKFGAY